MLRPPSFQEGTLPEQEKSANWCMLMILWFWQSTMKMLKFTCSASNRLGVCMGCNWIGTNWKCFQCDVKHASKNPMEIMWFRKSRCFIWEVSCVTMAVLGLSWIDALALQGRNFKHCAVSGTTLFSLRQRRSEFLKLAYFRNCCIVCTQHGSTKPNWEDLMLFKQNVSEKSSTSRTPLWAGSQIRLCWSKAAAKKF